MFDTKTLEITRKSLLIPPAVVAEVRHPFRDGTALSETSLNLLLAIPPDIVIKSDSLPKIFVQGQPNFCSLNWLLFSNSSASVWKSHQ